MNDTDGHSKLSKLARSESELSINIRKATSSGTHHGL